MSIITTTELGNYLGKDLSSDAKASLVVDAINGFIEEYTGRVFGEVKDFTEEMDYSPVIFLSHMDITEVTILKINDVEMEGYKWNQSGRVVLSASGRNYSGNRHGYDSVEVTYKSGVASVPPALKMAAVQLAGDYYANTGTNEVSQASVGGYTVTFGNQSGNGEKGSKVGGYLSVLNLFRVRRV